MGCHDGTSNNSASGALVGVFLSSFRHCLFSYSLSLALFLPYIHLHMVYFFLCPSFPTIRTQTKTKSIKRTCGLNLMCANRVVAKAQNATLHALHCHLYAPMSIAACLLTLILCGTELRRTKPIRNKMKKKNSLELTNVASKFQIGWNQNTNNEIVFTVIYTWGITQALTPSHITSE